MSWNPIDWPAGPFLVLYIALAMVVIGLGYGYRSSMGRAATTVHQLTVLELAYLAGGAARLGDAALLCLTSANGASIAPKTYKITVIDQTPLVALTGRSPLASVQPDMTRQQFQKAVKPLVERVQHRLQQFGYCPTDDQMASFRLTLLPFVGLLLAFGGIKAIVGSERGHPIGFLIALLVIVGFVGIMLAKRPTRTRAGNEALESHKTSNARAARAPLEHELMLALALSGAVVLSGTAYASVYSASQTMSSSGGDGGSGCGGGGGGCGGCS